MIRIAVYLTTEPGSGGAHQYAEAVVDALLLLPKDTYQVQAWYTDLQWADVLQRKNITSIYIDPGVSPRPWLKPIRKLCRQAAKLFFWGKKAQRYIQWLEQPLYSAFHAWSPDIVLYPQVGALDIPPKFKQVNVIHDLMHRYEARFPEAGSAKNAQARDRMFSFVVADSAAILVESELGKRQVIETYQCAAEKIHVVPLTVHKGLLAATPERPAELPAGLEGKYLFYPAQFWLHKNHVTLLEAVSLLRPTLKISCIFVGTSDKNGYQPYLEARKRLGLESQVHHLGYVNEAELAFLYTHARCMVMPTFFGPTNIPPLEAMAFGCPVAVSRIYGMPDQLKDAALYFDPKSPQEIANAIRSLWLDDRQRETLIQKGKICSQNNAPDVFEKKIFGVLSQLANYHEE